MPKSYLSVASTILGVLALSPKIGADDFFAEVQVIRNKAVLSTQTSRSLASIIATFSRTYHVQIVYEDAPLAFAGDIVNLAGPDMIKAGRHVWVPRGGPLRTEFLLSNRGEPANAKEALAGFIRSYESQRYPGQYHVLDDSGLLSVLPSEAKSANGILQTVTPLMLTHVSFGQRDITTVGEGIEKVLRRLGEQGHKISMGTLLPAQMQTQQFTGDLKNVTAEEAIKKLLDESDAKMSWLLLYDPEFKNYVFTLYAVGN